MSRWNGIGEGGEGREKKNSFRVRVRFVHEEREEGENGFLILLPPRVIIEKNVE